MWARIGAALKNNLIFYAVLTVRPCPGHHSEERPVTMQLL